MNYKKLHKLASTFAKTANEADVEAFFQGFSVALNNTDIWEPLLSELPQKVSAAFVLAANNYVDQAYDENVNSLGEQAADDIDEAYRQAASVMGKAIRESMQSGLESVRPIVSETDAKIYGADSELEKQYPLD